MTFLLLAIVVALVWLITSILEERERRYDVDTPWWVVIGACIGAIVGLALAAWCHYEFERHLDGFNLWWCLVPLLAVIPCVPLLENRGNRWPAIAAISGFVLIGVSTAAGDGLNRAAAAIPIGVGTLVVLIGLVCVVGLTQASSRR